MKEKNPSQIQRTFTNSITFADMDPQQFTDVLGRVLINYSKYEVKI